MSNSLTMSIAFKSLCNFLLNTWTSLLMRDVSCKSCLRDAAPFRGSKLGPSSPWELRICQLPSFSCVTFHRVKCEGECKWTGKEVNNRGVLEGPFRIQHTTVRCTCISWWVWRSSLLCELKLRSGIAIVLPCERLHNVRGITDWAAREDLQPAGWTITSASLLRLCDVAQVCKQLWVLVIHASHDWEQYARSWIGCIVFCAGPVTN